MEYWNIGMMQDCNNRNDIDFFPIIHTFGADMKWHPHIHLIVTGGGLRLDARRWIGTDPRWPDLVGVSYNDDAEGAKTRYPWHLYQHSCRNDKN